MKKVFSFLCVLTMVIALAAPAFALSKDDVMNEINSGFTIGSKTKQVPAEYVNAAQKFLDTHTLTDAQITSIVADIKAAKATAVAGGETEFEKMDAATQQSIISSVQKAADTAGLKITVNSDKKSVAVTDASGNAIFDNGGTGAIKTTGAQVNTSVAVILSIVIFTIIGAASVVACKRGLVRE